MCCTNSAQNNKEMDGVEVIDLCSVSHTKSKACGKGKESAEQESQEKNKNDTTDKMDVEIRTKKSKPMTKNKEVKTAMMCWEAVNDLSEKEPPKEQEKEGEKPVKKMEKPKHEEEHVKPTLNIGNRLKVSIEEFSWDEVDDESTLYTQETKQRQLVYITNLKNGLQKNGTKLNDEEGPNDKKPAAKNRLIEEPTLNNLYHVYESYEEFGSDNSSIEDFVKGENKKNMKEKDYTNINKKKEGK